MSESFSDCLILFLNQAKRVAKNSFKKWKMKSALQKILLLDLISEKSVKENVLWVAGRLRSGAAGVGGTFTLRDHVQPLSQISTPSPSPQQTSANPRPRRRQKALQKILNRDFKALRIFCKPLRALQKILTI